MANKTKKGNYESLKFLAVLAAIFVIILVIYFISRGSGAKKPPIDVNTTPSTGAEATPGPSVAVSNTPATTPTVAATSTPEATAEPSVSVTPEASETPEPTTSVTPEVTPSKAPTNTPTPTLGPIKSSEAKKALETIVDPTIYTATLISGSFSPNGDSEKYFRYSITETATKKEMQPEILVHCLTASIYCYQDGKVFDCVQFPLDSTETGGGSIPENKKITADEAVKILMTYGRDQLKLPSDPSNYTAQVEKEPDITLADADGIQAYLIILVDKSDRFMGAYAVSVDGIFVYIRDEMDPNLFERIIEG